LGEQGKKKNLPFCFPFRLPTSFSEIMGDSFSSLSGGGKYKFRTFKDAVDNKATFREIGLTNGEVKVLFYKFRKADKRNNRRLDKECFLDLISAGKELYSLSTRIFRVFDENSDGLVDFFEFVIGCWNYCTSSYQNLTTLAFDIYDRKTKGFITPEDITDMMIDFYGVKYQDNKHAMETLQKIRTLYPNWDSGLKIGEFQKFSRNHQNMLHPVFALQRCLQTRTLGLSNWENIAKRTEAIRRAGNFALTNNPNTKEEKRKPEGGNQIGALSGTLHARQTSQPAENSPTKQPPEVETFKTSTKNTRNGGPSKPKVYVEEITNAGQRGPRVVEGKFSSLENVQEDKLKNEQLKSPLQPHKHSEPDKILRLRPSRTPIDSEESSIPLPLNLTARPNLAFTARNISSSPAMVAPQQQSNRQKPPNQTISRQLPRTQLNVPYDEALGNLSRHRHESKSRPNSPFTSTQELQRHVCM